MGKCSHCWRVTVKRLLSVLVLLCAPVFATTVTLTVTDADSQTWNNGTYTATFIPPALTDPNLLPATPTVTGSLSGTGTASLTLTDNATLLGSQWRFIVCPAASSTCYTYGPITVTGATQTVAIAPPAIRIPGGSAIALAYADTEISSPAVGAQYYSLTLLSPRRWNGTAWTNTGSAQFITPGTDATLVIAGQIQRVIYKATVTGATCAGFTGAALTADCTIATLPAKTEITRIIADNTVGFTCSSVCTGTKTVQVGKTAGGTQYLLAKDATAVATYGLVNGDLGASLATTASTPVGGGDLPSWSATTALLARYVSGTGNWGNGTVTTVNAGSTTFYIETLTFP